MKWLIVFLFAVSCSPVLSDRIGAVSPPLPPMDNDTCDGRRHADLIGQHSTALEKVLILRQVRIIRAGQMYTQDYRPARINFHINASAKIERISCG